MEAMAIKIYTLAREFAETKGVIIADTKFEFGVDENGKLVLADEVLTPDSSRFWPLESYVPEKSQPRYSFSFFDVFSYDKQYLRDYLLSINFDKKNGVELPKEVVEKTVEKYTALCKIFGA